MIVLRSTLDKAVKEAVEITAATYESRISDLKEQITDLKRLVFIPKAEPAPSVYEADNVISASEKPYAISEEEHTKIVNALREADYLISGNYEEDYLN